MDCHCCLLAISLLTLWTRVSGVYVFNGHPYEQTEALGVGILDLSKEGDGVPIHTKVVYPIEPGEYTPILFIPGLNGVVYPEVYSTVSARIASFGYVLIEVDLYWPVEDTLLDEQSIVGINKRSDFILEDVDNLKRNPELAFKVLDWLRNNLLQRLLPNAGSPNVTVDWSRMGLLCHSLGADTIIRMLQQNSTFAKAAMFLDPGSSNFKAPLNYSVPSLMVGTQLCMEFPACCIKGLSYFHFYSNLQCPKIVMNVTNFGHCSVIDEIAWDACHVIRICKTNEASKRTIYRNVFIPGLLASFFGSYLQGNSVLLKYAITPDLMPLPLGQLEYNVTCT